MLDTSNENQLSMFSDFQLPTHFDEIDGLNYIENYIDNIQHDWLLNKIDEQEWLTDLKRRVQHYGFKYDYKARKINLDMRIGDIPDWLIGLSKMLYNDSCMRQVSDQVIINEYQPGQGISNHVDCEPCFDDMIVSLSLGSGCLMNFTNKADTTKKTSFWLEPRSLVILKGDARYKWLHGIAARKSDIVDNKKRMRTRRVSLTFRNVILENDII